MVNVFCVALVRRTFICFAIIAVLASFVPGPVRAQGPMLPLCCHMRVTVQNDSTTCVWASVAIGPSMVPSTGFMVPTPRDSLSLERGSSLAAIMRSP